jgi:hypothetical protein
VTEEHNDGLEKKAGESLCGFSPAAIMNRDQVTDRLPRWKRGRRVR